eukprot:6184498-Pleurochrysis_carterae.AAC.3
MLINSGSLASRIRSLRQLHTCSDIARDARARPASLAPAHASCYFRQRNAGVVKVHHAQAAGCRLDLDARSHDAAAATARRALIAATTPRARWCVACPVPDARCARSDICRHNL